MYPFNLERALAGEPLVDGRGLEYTEFYERAVVDDYTAKYPFMAYCINTGILNRYTQFGKYSVNEALPMDDLYMVYESAEAYQASLTPKPSTEQTLVQAKLEIETLYQQIKKLKETIDQL